jgi:hypothetical protein
MQRRQHGQRGQALLESFVALLALVPLLLAVLWLGRVLALRQASIEASRLLAFECTVRPQACADPAAQARLADEARRRVFSRVDAPILSAETLADSPAADERNPLWVDAAGRPLLARMSDVAVSVSAQRFDAGGAVATGGQGGAAGALLNGLSSLAGPAHFGLALSEGLFAATVQVASVPVAGMRMAFPGLQMQARTAILTDAWNATSARGLEAGSSQSRVDRGARLPALQEAALDARYLPVRGLIALMEAVGLEPTGGALRYHQWDVTVVPPDRLGGGSALAVDRDRGRP